MLHSDATLDIHNCADTGASENSPGVWVHRDWCVEFWPGSSRACPSSQTQRKALSDAAKKPYEEKYAKKVVEYKAALEEYSKAGGAGEDNEADGELCAALCHAIILAEGWRTMGKNGVSPPKAAPRPNLFGPSCGDWPWPPLHMGGGQPSAFCTQGGRPLSLGFQPL